MNYIITIVRSLHFFVSKSMIYFVKCGDFCLGVLIFMQEFDTAIVHDQIMTLKLVQPHNYSVT